MKKTIIALFLLPLAAWSCNQVDQVDPSDKFSALPEDDALNFIVANDLGRVGYYDQVPIAQEMGSLAERADIEFVVAPGDVHHYLGIQSVADPLWTTNYERIYAHPELQIEWLPVLGNHEYHGNTQAVIDYSSVSRRWTMPGRYYTRSFEVADNTTLRLVFVDTAPMIDKYRSDPEYPDAGKQDLERQLRWIDSVLTASAETWTIVVGHHPVYAGTDKNQIERTDMQQRLDPLLRRHGVDYYICGHIHNFQHNRVAGSSVDYVVNSSGSLSREVERRYKALGGKRMTVIVDATRGHYPLSPDAPAPVIELILSTVR